MTPHHTESAFIKDALRHTWALRDHGFGLHSGVLAAQEMGGSLRAHSDGVGQGATFTHELPLHTSEPAG